jgi:hypothetical protein
MAKNVVCEMGLSEGDAAGKVRHGTEMFYFFLTIPLRRVSLNIRKKY